MSVETADVRDYVRDELAAVRACVLPQEDFWHPSDLTVVVVASRLQQLLDNREVTAQQIIEAYAADITAAENASKGGADA